jgi:outer membrane protein OmpA-like peptidoglycan-associated protein
MKTFKTTTMLVAAAGMLFAATATAQLNDAVKNTNGHVVTNTFKNCVITKWQGGEGCNIAPDMRIVYFDFDSIVLTPAAKAKLDVLADMIKGNTGARIVGFADELGDTGYNQGLSMRRANAVADYLTGLGVNITGASEVRGLGETSSQSECKGSRGAALKACLWRDRRVEVELVN